jgi:hypothetical protein
MSAQIEHQLVAHPIHRWKHSLKFNKVRKIVSGHQLVPASDLLNELRISHLTRSLKKVRLADQIQLSSLAIAKHLSQGMTSRAARLARRYQQQKIDYICLFRSDQCN